MKHLKQKQGSGEIIYIDCGYGNQENYSEELAGIVQNMIDQRPDWCRVGLTFKWYAEHITGDKWVTEKIIGYTDDGFLHTAYNCPVYETKFNNLNDGYLIKGV